MKKVSVKKTVLSISEKTNKTAANSLRQSRIERLKEMINNEEYVNEAISKLAGSLTSGLMK